MTYTLPIFTPFYLAMAAGRLPLSAVRVRCLFFLQSSAFETRAALAAMSRYIRYKDLSLIRDLLTGDDQVIPKSLKCSSRKGIAKNYNPISQCDPRPLSSRN